MKVIIECEKLTERRKAHRYLAKKLEFPDYYGGNLDALYDVLTGLPHKDGRYAFLMPGAEAPEEVAAYAARIKAVFAEAGKDVL